MFESSVVWDDMFELLHVTTFFFNTSFVVCVLVKVVMMKSWISQLTFYYLYLPIFVIYVRVHYFLYLSFVSTFENREPIPYISLFMCIVIID